MYSPQCSCGTTDLALSQSDEGISAWQSRTRRQEAPLAQKLILPDSINTHYSLTHVAGKSRLRTRYVSSGPGDVGGRGLVDCGGQGELTLVLGGGLRLEIGNGFNGATLRRVLGLLGDVG